MAEINDLEVTDASNTARFPENQLPSTVNNGARALEGIIARWYKDNNGTIAVSGTDTYTATINVDTGFALYDGYTIVVDFANANTGAATINLTPDGGSALGAKAIVKGQSTALAGGEIVAGQKVALIYNGTAFQMMSPTASNVEEQVDYAEEWANKAEDSLVSTAAGGDGVDDYSALHHANKASASASAASTSETNAATSETNAAASATAAATSETNAATSETNAANSAASAAASAQGFAGVTLITASSTDIETTDARTYYQVDASSNTVSLNLPSIGTGNDGLSYTVEVLDVSNAITLVRDGSDTINGVAGNYTGLVEAGQVIQIIADDGTPDNWIVVQASALKVDNSTVELNGRTIRVKDNGVTPAKVSGSVNAQTGTSYTLVIGDAFKTVTMDNASANTLTIPTNASVAFSTGDRIDVIMKGAGVTTITGDTGVTVNGVSAGSGDLAQYGACSLLKVDTNTWLATGITAA